MTESDWATTLASTVAAEMKRLRSRPGRKLSIRKLADRTAELGYPISADVLTNFEVGRRGARLDVAELLVLAAALDVPPALLLFPGYPDGAVEHLPGRHVRSHTATSWLSGERALRTSSSGEATLSNFPYELVSNAHERQKLGKRVRFLGAVTDFTEDSQERADAIEEAEAGRKRIEELEGQIRELGGVVDGGQG